MHKLLLLVPVTLCLLGAALPGCGESQKPSTTRHPILLPTSNGSGAVQICFTHGQQRVSDGMCQIKGEKGAFSRRPSAWPPRLAV